MESWFCIWDDLENPKIVLNLIPNPLHYQNVSANQSQINAIKKQK
jgi:hypothetical protein